MEKWNLNEPPFLIPVVLCGFLVVVYGNENG